jgi:hypothetical protein
MIKLIYHERSASFHSSSIQYGSKK